MNTQIELLTINNKQVPAVTSLQVAELFEKRHDIVLRDVREAFQNIDNLAALKFVDGEYIDKNNQKRPMYILDKDAFILLTMGYTTKKAMNIKIKYIQQFNAMEKMIQNSFHREEYQEEDNELILSKALLIMQDKVKAVEEKLEIAECTIKANAEHVNHSKALMHSKGAVLVNILAKILNRHLKININQDETFHWLRENEYLMKKQGKLWNLPTQSSINNGFMEVVFHKQSNRFTPYITQKGIKHFVNIFKKFSADMLYFKKLKEAYKKRHNQSTEQLSLLEE